MLKLLLQKIMLNFKLDLKWLFKAPLPITSRVSFLLRKYFAIVGKRDHLLFCGHDFYYDNRLTPALLPDYLFEILELGKSIELGSLKSVLDIGANIGQFGATISNFAPEAQIFSFEPNAEIFPILERNSARIPRWRAFPFGISNESGSRGLHYVPGKSSQGSIYSANASQGLLSHNFKSIKVEFKKLDSAELARLKIPGHYDLIKIDVEGAEAEVLSSLTQLTWRYLYIELAEGRDGALSLSEALDLLSKNERVQVSLVKSTSPAGPGQIYQALFINNKLSALQHFDHGAALES